VSRTAVKLSALPEIDWTCWDPIGIRAFSTDWPADEYDTYLMVAFGMTQNDKLNEEVAAYLTKTASAHMGLSGVDGAAELATAKRLSGLAQSLT
jgi:hypothetical protein